MKCPILTSFSVDPPLGPPPHNVINGKKIPCYEPYPNNLGLGPKDFELILVVYQLGVRFLALDELVWMTGAAHARHGVGSSESFCLVNMICLLLRCIF